MGAEDTGESVVCRCPGARIIDAYEIGVEVQRLRHSIEKSVLCNCVASAKREVWSRPLWGLTFQSSAYLSDASERYPHNILPVHLHLRTISCSWRCRNESLPSSPDPTHFARRRKNRHHRREWRR